MILMANKVYYFRGDGRPLFLTYGPTTTTTVSSKEEERLMDYPHACDILQLPPLNQDRIYPRTDLPLHQERIWINIYIYSVRLRFLFAQIHSLRFTV